MAFEGVIFDLDGTLFDSLVDLADSMNRVLQRNSFPAHDLPAYRYFIGEGMRNLVRRALPEKYRQEEIITACYEALLKEYAEHCVDKTKPFAGINDLLAELTLRRIKMAVFSNKIDELTKKVVLTLLPDWNFEVLVGTSAAVPRKPDPSGALLISTKLGIPPEKLVYAGDSGVDMQAANSAGMYAVGVLWGYREKEELIRHGAKKLISHPRELLDLFTGKRGSK
jgi:phosphoglycolate phosphatase